MKIDADECEQMQESGEYKECIECSCSVCIVNQTHWDTSESFFILLFYTFLYLIVQGGIESEYKFIKN